MNLYSLMEILLIFVYIDFVIVLGIIIKPSFYVNLLVFTYCCITTFNILKTCNLSNKQINLKYFITLMFTLLYSLFCTYCYVMFHKLYHKYIKRTKKLGEKMNFLCFILLVIPCMYFINIKLQEYYFNCSDHHIIIDTISTIGFKIIDSMLVTLKQIKQIK